MAIFRGCYPGEIALSLLVHLYVYKCPYFVVAFFVTLRRFLPPGSPSFLVIVLHFDLPSVLQLKLCVQAAILSCVYVSGIWGLGLWG